MFRERVISQKDINRFFKYVKKIENGCWEWQGSLPRHGYGTFSSQSINYPAHKFAWIITNGTYEKGLLLCHKCDNRKCVNPDHIFLGTPKENSEDMVSKDRSCRGHRNTNTKLTEDNVKEIRISHENGSSFEELALRYNVTKSAIYSIVKRINWKHVI